MTEPNSPAARGPLAATVVPLVERLNHHIARMAPHQKERAGGVLIIECAAGLRSQLPDDAMLCLWAGATGYYLGRMTYEVEEFCNLLIQQWPTLPPTTQQVVRQYVEAAFKRGNLGMDMDRAQWERARALWHNDTATG